MWRNFQLQGPGVVTIIISKSKANSMFKGSLTQDSNDFDRHMTILAEQMKREINDNTLKNEYSPLDNEALRDQYIQTLQDLLLKISPKFENTAVDALISSIIVFIEESTLFLLQVVLGLLINSKTLVQQLNKFSMVASYEEIRHFKI